MQYQLIVTIDNKSHVNTIQTNALVTLATLFGNYPLTTWIDIKNAVGNQLYMYTWDKCLNMFSTEHHTDQELTQWLINVYCLQLPDLIDRLSVQIRTQLLASEEDITIEPVAGDNPLLFNLTTSYYGDIDTTSMIKVTNPLTGEFISL